MDAKFLPANDTACAFLGLLHRKGAVDIAEDLSLLFKDIWEDSLAELRITLSRVAIHENVLLPAVTVEIAEQYDLALFILLSDQLLHVVQHWMLLLCRLLPLPVHVLANETAAGIAENDAVGVHHRDDFEHKVVAEDSRADAWPHQIVDSTLDHPAGACLARVHSRRKYNRLLVLRLLLILRLRRDGQHVDRVAGVRLTEQLAPKTILRHRIVLELEEVALQICEGVRIAVREVNSVKIMIELNSPGERVISASGFLRNPILIVAHITADTLPTLAGLSILTGVHERLHAVVVQTIRLE